ncbi:MAG: hypothetical protein IPP32_15600 [Bacteroidetes bacterium]|nr:hypothetical protein [Bacteroidota bacterium]
MKNFYNNLFYDKYGKTKIQGLHSSLFYGGILLKLVLGTFLASDYLTKLFIPFVNYFVETGTNPYDYFSVHGVGDGFPYPPLMLYIVALPRLLLSPFIADGIDQVTFLHLFSFRIILLFFDTIILFTLLRWLKTHHRKVLLFYWLNPVLIYITYIHGQLDVIPVALMFAGLYFMFKEKWMIAFFIIGLSITTKSNMVLLLPFVVIYAFKSNTCNHIQLAKSLAILMITIGLVNLPFLNSQGFIKMVYNNPVQQKALTPLFTFDNNLGYYGVVGAMVFLIYRMLSFQWVNRDLLLMFLAFSFGVFTVLIAPMQGWYYWILPLFIYFVIKHQTEKIWLFASLCVSYIIYFALTPVSDFFKVFSLINPAFAEVSFHSILGYSPNIVNIGFTLMQSMLLLFLAQLYLNGISSFEQIKFLSRPLLLGVGGDSGAGKSTFTTLVDQLFGKNFTTVVRGDDMHKWERGNENWSKVTHLNPKANDIHKDLGDIRQLKDGYSVLRKKYDHNNGEFTLPFQIKSNRLVMFEGLHPFYLKSQADLYDLKVFIKPDERIRIHRKLKRDVGERGKTTEGVLQQLKDREGDSEKYIQGQQQFADIVFSFVPVGDDLDKEALEITLSNDIPLDDLVLELSANGDLDITHEFIADNKQWLKLNGSISQEAIELMAYELLPELEELGIYEPQWQSDYNGIIQLLLAKCIFDNLK